MDVNTLLTIFVCIGPFPCEPRAFRFVLDPASCVAPNVVDMRSGDYAWERVYRWRHVVIDWPNRGDVDGDGDVDVDDIERVLRAFIEQIPEENEAGADVCGCYGQYIVDIDDVEGVLAAFMGVEPCQGL